MRVAASAPGKLVLLGEYAVLEGAPALVMAVNRRARVVLGDGVEGEYRLRATSIGIGLARCRLDARGELDWLDTDPAVAARLGVVAAVLGALAAERDAPPGFCAELDTDTFFAGSDGSNKRAKIGLGSSAALTVALAGAICAGLERDPPALEALVGAHRRLQQGRGSGLDIAASLTGGMLAYRLTAGEPTLEQAQWPAALGSCCVWTGKSASTADFLGRVAAWRVRAPRDHARLMGQLGACAATGVAATSAGDVQGLLDTVAEYARLLGELGAASGTDIVSAEHAKLATLAERCGVAYKPCGAGGGDIGIALAGDADRLRDFRRDIEAAGFQPLDLGLDAVGLRVH
ncbi:MAG TPA: hypothetical protein VFG73_01580 [Rhodanobacteraceae bacterium]|nr:hypothetical protein [Rhodanobacteraceae bacterium]